MDVESPMIEPIKCIGGFSSDNGKLAETLLTLIKNEKISATAITGIANDAVQGILSLIHI